MNVRVLPRTPQTLKKLKQLGDRRMAEAHQTVVDAHRIAAESRTLRREIDEQHHQERMIVPTAEA